MAGVIVGALARHGEGPKYLKAGRGLRSRVLYRGSELVASLDSLKLAKASEHCS